MSKIKFGVVILITTALICGCGNVNSSAKEVPSMETSLDKLFLAEPIIKKVFGSNTNLDNIRNSCGILEFNESTNGKIQKNNFWYNDNDKFTRLTYNSIPAMDNYMVEFVYTIIKNNDIKLEDRVYFSMFVSYVSPNSDFKVSSNYWYDFNNKTVHLTDVALISYLTGDTLYTEKTKEGFSKKTPTRMQEQDFDKKLAELYIFEKNKEAINQAINKIDECDTMEMSYDPIDWKNINYDEFKVDSVAVIVDKLSSQK